MLRKRNWIAACAAVLALNIVGVYSAFAEEDSLKDGARKAGRAVGTAAREVWQEGKKVGKEIGHGAAKVGKEIGHGAAKAGKAVGGAAKEGARELKRAIKGEK
jgi:stage III sporulation protein SpoIIIAA